MYTSVRSLTLPVLILASLFIPATPALGQNAEDGLFVTVRNPISSDVVQQVRNQVDQRLNKEGRPLRVVVFDFNPDDKDVTNANFGTCYELADYIDQLRARTTTVAFVHGKATGHTVLPILACKELVMSKSGAFGSVLTDSVRTVKDIEQKAYEKFAGDRKAQWAAIRKMFDPSVELALGVANPGGAFPAGAKVYIDKANAAERKSVAVPADVTFTQPGQVALYTADQARTLELSKGSAETRQEVAELYSLPPSVTQIDILQGRSPEAYRYTLTGEVDGAMKESMNRILRDLKRKKGNVLILTLECSGGDLGVARSLADDLRAAGTGDDAIEVIAYVPESAPDSAAFIAFGCHKIVMSKRKDTADPDRPNDYQEATLGDFERFIKENRPGTVDAHRKSLKELAEGRGVPGIGILVDGMFDRDLEIVQAVKKNQATHRRLMSRAELEADKDNWTEARQIKPKGQLLKLTASMAEELGVARYTVDTQDPAGVYSLYGLDPSRVKEVTPGWLDRFAEFLRLPVVTVLLVVIGFTGLILELKVPGLTVPGIIAALCFILVFWSQSRFSGEMFVLALLLFILGLALVGLEIFVLPGFGAPGIFGIMCMLAGLGLVTFERVPQTSDEWGLLGVKVSQYMFGMIGAFGLAFIIAKFLPRVPYANRLMLAPPTSAEGAVDTLLPGAEEAAGLLGAIGTTNTPLRPAGVVRFGDKFIDVVSDGGFIAAGTRVQVIAVEGVRIVVKEV